MKGKKCFTCGKPATAEYLVRSKGCASHSYYCEAHKPREHYNLQHMELTGGK